MAMHDHADLLVVGAGTVGGWLSVFAREAGCERVVVVDQGMAGYGSSIRAAGMVRTQGGTPTAVHLGQETVAFYAGQHERYGIDSGFRSLGYAILAFGEDDRQAAADRLAMQAAEGLPSRWVEPAALAALAPHVDVERLAGATFCALDGAIDPPRNVTAYMTVMHRLGVDVRERTRVTGLVLDGTRVRGVETDRGPITADRVVLAGGYGQGRLARLAGVEVPVGAVRHTVAVTGPLPSVASDAVMGFDLAAGLYWRPEEDGLLFGWSNPDEAPGEARGVDWAFAERMRARLGELVPAAAGAGLRRIWAATIDYTPDHLPVVGPARTPAGEELEGLTLASAAGHGMMWGPAVSRIGADLALHGTTAVTDVSLLGIDRFRPDGTSRLATDPIALPFPDRAAAVA
jgi:sarcosine oxidase subunit beta